jgi:putative transposase
MGRPLRAAVAGLVYHTLNRANARLPLFQKDGDYAAFEKVLYEAHERFDDVRVLAYCIMPNHWHLVLQPTTDQGLSRFLNWLTLTHTQRWHAHYHSAGSGHLYQGRFKSFPVESDAHFLTVCRYVERNALRAALVGRAEQWRWGSLWLRCYGNTDAQGLLSPWPVPPPGSWVEWVNEAQSVAELEALRRCVQRGQPYGNPAWVHQTIERFQLHSTVRPQGRPRKRPSAIGS